MKENLRPGPKVPGKLAKTGEYCPPGSEGSKVYRGIRPWRRVCKRRGHPKPHPGRCILCRHLSEKARDMKPQRAKQKKAANDRWRAKPKNRVKRAACDRRRNARQEQKDAAALRMQKYRRGERLNNPGKPAEVAARLLAKAAAMVKQKSYGYEQIGNYNP
jgi:hypothetical protein